MSAMSLYGYIVLAAQSAQFLIAFTGLIFCLTQTRHSPRLWIFVASFAGFTFASGIGMILRMLMGSIVSATGGSSRAVFYAIGWGTSSISLVSTLLFIAGLHLFMQEFRQSRHRDERI